MQTVIYGLAVFGAVCAVAVAVQLYRDRLAEHRIASGDIDEISHRIAGLISKVDPDHHGKLFSQVGGRLIDLGVLHTAGACYRVSVEIYDTP